MELSNTPSTICSAEPDPGRLLRLHRWATRSRASIALVILAPFSIAALLSAPPFLEGSWADFGFDSMGWILFFIGAALRWWSTLYIGGRKTSALATQGPYSICRNPLYLGTLFMCLAVAAFLQSATFAIGLLLAGAIYLSTTISTEERRLSERFGSEYAQYCEAVPRLIPRFAKPSTAATIDVSIKGLYAEAIRTARWIWLPIVCQLIAQLRADPRWPHLFKLP